MKLLVFHIGADRYGLRLSDVSRVLPLMELKHLPLAPDSVAGLMDYHGQSVPVIDLCRMSGLPASPDYFGTRIIVVNYPAPEGTMHLLGLRAENVAGVQEVSEVKLTDSGVKAAPFLGQVASDEAGMLQLVELEWLLPAALRVILFQPGETAATDLAS